MLVQPSSGRGGLRVVQYDHRDGAYSYASEFVVL